MQVILSHPGLRQIKGRPQPLKWTHIPFYWTFFTDNSNHSKFLIPNFFLLKHKPRCCPLGWPWMLHRTEGAARGAVSTWQICHRWHRSAFPTLELYSIELFGCHWKISSKGCPVLQSFKASRYHTQLKTRRHSEWRCVCGARCLAVPLQEASYPAVSYLWLLFPGVLAPTPGRGIDPTIA